MQTHPGAVQSKHQIAVGVQWVTRTLFHFLKRETSIGLCIPANEAGGSKQQGRNSELAGNILPIWQMLRTIMHIHM